MIRYKISICDALKEVKYSSYRLEKDRILASGTWSKLSRGEPVSLKISRRTLVTLVVS